MSRRLPYNELIFANAARSIWHFHPGQTNLRFPAANGSESATYPFYAMVKQRGKGAYLPR